ncbi:MAG: MBL fold metallo-hydrolase, partial [Burkholderiaceae bacterium]|nr:MBL fold metallo-hydrolase [Burkholderiaceae bacterium]
MPSVKPLSVLAVPILSDNYVWLIHNGSQAVAVDPGVAAPVADALAANGLTLAAIVLTHKHDDHTGGAAELRQRFNVP